MQSRTIILGILALTCGASAVVGVNQLTQRWNDKPVDVSTTTVVTMTANVARGIQLSEKVLTVQLWPKELVPPGALTKLSDAVERSVLVPLVKGEPVLEGKLATKDAGRGLAAMIPKGMRAFTIQTPSEVAGVGGFILPGDNVDVLLTMNNSGPTDETGGGETKTLLQNVQVLAVAQHLDAPEANKVDPKELNNVTLLVTPGQAAELDLGMNKGVLHLTLRHPDDDVDANAETASLAKWRGKTKKWDVPDHWALVGKALLGAMANPTVTPDDQVEKVVPKSRSAEEGEFAVIRTIRGVHHSAIRISIPNSK